MQYRKCLDIFFLALRSIKQLVLAKPSTLLFSQWTSKGWAAQVFGKRSSSELKFFFPIRADTWLAKSIFILFPEFFFFALKSLILRAIFWLLFVSAAAIFFYFNKYFALAVLFGKLLWFCFFILVLEMCLGSKHDCGATNASHIELP